MTDIEKFGLVVIRENKLLLCLPYAFEDLITVGGVKEGNETHIDNLLREVAEELGTNSKLNLNSLRYLGRFSDYAAGRTNRRVNIDLYIGEVDGEIKPTSEIKELIWFQPNLSYKLSPVLEKSIIPFLLKSEDLIWPSWRVNSLPDQSEDG
jgi:8-oxo-dGTP diphosphatase